MLFPVSRIFIARIRFTLHSLPSQETLSHAYVRSERKREWLNVIHYDDIDIVHVSHAAGSSTLCVEEEEYIRQSRNNESIQIPHKGV